MNLLIKSAVSTAVLAIASTNIASAYDPFSFSNYQNPPSMPNQSAFYVGGSIGSMTADGFCNSCDDSDMGWKLFGGYDYSDVVAVEVGYNSLGKVKSTTQSSEVTGFSAAGVGKFKINDQIGVFGKAGIFKWDAENTNEDRNATDLMLGAGANYQYNDNIKLRAEWERFMDVETSTTSRSDLDYLSAGFTYQTM
ncbi:MAG: Unknown protein [uncultured Thiotrichaceae bacterium]|uniref:Outer membrane protein OmpA-like transmembrane domain-containing protein n=1 Tax=uncultured Thiotrichaceae bacterium TaxID=298394 RepID=A0A6S6U3N0_9GAMM|nr:MAG: Unknown protein [uncultured Thiotrichaceae bacterium]